MIISRSVRAAANGIVLFFFVAEQYSIVYMYHLFTHSSHDGHFGSLRVLAKCKQCCSQHWIHVSFRVMAFSKYMPRSGIARSLLALYLVFKKPLYYFPQWLHQFSFPSAVQEGLLCSMPSPAFIVCRLFDDGHCDQCEMIPRCSFDLHYSIISSEVEQPFMCLWPSVCLLWRNVYLDLLPIF